MAVGARALPPEVLPYRRTREFSERTIPAALRSRHATAAGVWGLICVVRGALRYRILEPQAGEQILSPGRPGVIEPERPHEVEPVGEVRFYVEFFRHPS